MSLLPIARLLSECAIYYTLLLMLPYEWSTGMLLGTALICGAGCSMAGHVQEKTLLRCLCALIPPLALLLSGQTLQRCFLAVPVLYAELLILTSNVYADAWRYARHIKLSMIFELLFLIIGCTLRTERAFWILFWGNVYFIFGVYCQHQLRLGSGVSWRGKVRDFAGVALPPLAAGSVCGFIAVGIEPIGKAVIGFVTVIGSLMRYVVGWSTHLFQNPKVDPVKVTLPSTEATEATIEIMTEGTFPDAWPQMELPPEVFRGLLLVGILALLGLLTYGIHRFQQRSTAARGTRTYEEANGTVAERPTKERSRDLSNRRKVRKTYASYLRLLQNRGMFRRLTDTSRDVLDASAAYADEQKGSDLRKIYIRARYHTALPVSDEDVQSAGDLLRELRREQKSDKNVTK